MKTLTYRYPDGATRAIVFSYDDGQIHDRRLVELFNRFGLKATFHLNSGMLDTPGFISASEIPELFRGHEVSCHSLTHPFLDQLPAERVAHEILEDRRILEAAAGYPMRGMSYPFGNYNDTLLRILPVLGMEYSRTIVSTGAFSPPRDFLKWHPTCHHREDLDTLLERFLSKWLGGLPVFHIWGHSFEFDRDGNWNKIEEFAERIASLPDTWSATCIELVSYMRAIEQLKCGVDGRVLYNPSAVPVWVTADGDPVKIGSGETVRL